MPEKEEVERSPAESLNLIAGLLRRGRWWIATSTFVVAVATAAVSERLPNVYNSDATLVVVQQQVSQRYVAADTTQTMTDAVNAITRNVLSRGKLLGIVDEYGLYPKQKKALNPDDLAELMRKDVLITPLDVSPRGDLNAFQITFTAGSPELAQAVTSRLTSLFIQENLTTRGNQAATTTNFLMGQLEVAKKKLAEQEQRVRDFKARNTGQLPDQQVSNLGVQAELRGQIQTAVANITRVRQQQVTLDSSLRERLGRLQTEKTTLLNKFTPQHPEVVKKTGEIERVEALLQRLNGGSSRGSQTGTGSYDAALGALQVQVDANAAELESYQGDERRLRAELAQSQNRMNMTPVIGQELDEMMRDYNIYNQTYMDLLSKQQQAQLTTNLEESQQGQQFRLVDPPTLPAKPASPNRTKISLGGVAGGLALGFVLAFLMDFKDNSFHSEQAIKERFTLPLVLAVPLILTPREERARRWKKMLEWTTVSVMTAVVGLAEFYIYRHS